ncbi:4a-hydroxytetrahydrobiopterin dehydratase [Candidatus Woesearchaeota archaeon]|nr:4a-hydroxytetrahydrobiopterin dehydratase [Candidatus Woesearchaeota archaeon]
MELTKKKCIPCEAGTPSLEKSKIDELIKQIPSWTLKEGHLYKKFKFKNFIDTMGFINKIAEIAENEGHHPDFCVHYNRVEIELWTHAIDGLSENDFIVAAKIDKLSK